MSRFVAVAVLALVSGCADVNSHVSGSFACKAPQGTCAPTLAIDDGALTRIGWEGNTAAVKHPSSPLPVPAPAPAPDGGAYPARQAHIVFPAYTDDKGRRHDAYGVYVTLNDARFADTAATRQAPSPISAAGSRPATTNLVAAASAQDDAVDPPPMAPAAAPPGLAGSRPPSGSMLRQRSEPSGAAKPTPGQAALVVQRVDPPDPVADAVPAPGSTPAPAQSFPASTVQP